jgi:hypothetical protein
MRTSWDAMNHGTAVTEYYLQERISIGPLSSGK